MITAEYSEHTGSWHINNKNQDNSVISRQQYGSRHMNAYEIMEHLLNLKEPKVYKTIEVPDGMGDTKEKRVVDIDATRVVQKKAERLKESFKKWIFQDPERREAIVEKYNALFNSVRPREYDRFSAFLPDDECGYSASRSSEKCHCTRHVRQQYAVCSLGRCRQNL